MLPFFSTREDHVVEMHLRCVNSSLVKYYEAPQDIINDIPRARSLSKVLLNIWVRTSNGPLGGLRFFHLVPYPSRQKEQVLFLQV